MSNTKKKLYPNDIIVNDIMFRYLMYNPERAKRRMPRNRIENMFMDSFYPFKVCKTVTDVTNTRNLEIVDYETNGYAISNIVADDMNVKKLHISELITMLGYNKTAITKLLRNVKLKKLIICLVGFGGSNTNFFHWVYEMASWTKQPNIFQKIFVVEPERFEVSNMLRVPFKPKFSHIDLPDPLKSTMIPKEFKYIAESSIGYVKRVDRSTISNYKRTGYETIFYGAPDMETRRFFADRPETFISCTHQDSRFALRKNPRIESDAIMETYGQINLSMFFMGHLYMTIKFLEYLADTHESITYREPQPEEDIYIFDFLVEFGEQMENGFKSGSKKLYMVNQLHYAQDPIEPAERR